MTTTLCGFDMSRILATIRSRESGGSYTARNPTSSASGAYQFIDSTWAGYGGYARAYLAPPSVQDAKAAAMVRGYLVASHCDLKWVPASWYMGWAGAHAHSWSYVPPGNSLSIQSYVDAWMGTYNRTPGGGPDGSSSGGGGVNAQTTGVVSSVCDKLPPALARTLPICWVASGIDATTGFLSLTSKLFEVHTWIRAAEVIGGIILIVMGLSFLTKSLGIDIPGISALTKAVAA